MNTFHLGYKNQSVYDVSGTSCCLFLDKYKTHKYSVGRAYSCWMLNQLVHHSVVYYGQCHVKALMVDFFTYFTYRRYLIWWFVFIFCLLVYLGKWDPLIHFGPAFQCFVYYTSFTGQTLRKVPLSTKWTQVRLMKGALSFKRRQGKIMLQVQVDLTLS